MNYEVVWSKFSEDILDEIFDYYENVANENIANKIALGIVLSTKRLMENPFLGPPEPLLANRAISYRYIVIGNYKIIYSVDEKEERIKIYDVFDTRQNPTKMSRFEEEYEF
jgi:toxin ParE1/3/4